MASSADAQRRTAALQALTVIPRADLRFGSLIRGHGTSVSARDEGRSALFEVQGPGGMPVRVEFLLPPSLLSDTGDDLRLEFGPGDGFAQVSVAHPPRGESFNPRNPLIAYLGGDGRLYLHIGGTAVARLLQTGGTYRAAILITLYDLGS